MTDLLDMAVADYKAILAPFLMMTSCATLVWALQNRFSRVAQAIRSLVSEGQRDGIDCTHSLAKQIAWLKGRSYLLRNSISGFYFAMCCFLSTAILLALATFARLQLSFPIVLLFLLGLLIVGASLATAILEISRSHKSLQEEVAHR